VYTEELVIVGSIVGNEVIDVIPIKEITEVNNGKPGTPRGRLSTAETDGTLDIDDTLSNADDPEPVANLMEVSIHTLPDGYNSGRVYRFRTLSNREATMLTEELGQLSAVARERSQAQAGKIQERVRVFYTSSSVQKFIAFLIFSVPAPSALH
jgi:hypothetical protein